MHYKSTLLFVILASMIVQLNAQIELYKEADSDSSQHKKITLKGFVDSYYGYHSAPNTIEKAPFFVSSDNVGQAMINLAFLEFGFESDRVRAKITPAFGSYMNDNYASEQGTLRHFMEGNVGVKLLKNKNLWLDGGIMNSPYSNETPISKDHICYTRALGGEYLPYYLTGAKLSYGINDKLTATLAYYNGWQEIQDVNDAPAFGAHVEYKASKKNAFYWDAYAGDERSALFPNYRNRYLIDFYWLHNMDGKFSLSLCGYVGLQETDAETNVHDYWAQFNTAIRYQFYKNFSVSYRAEIFEDQKELILIDFAPTQNKFLFSNTFGINWKVNQNALLRIEGRHFIAEKKIFDASDLTNQAFWGVVSLTAWF